MSLLDDENILIDMCKNQTRVFHRVLEISDVYRNPRRCQELINYLNTYLTFGDYKWVFLPPNTSIVLHIPDKWGESAAVVSWDKKNNKYIFDFIGNKNDHSYVDFKETMISVLNLYHNKSDVSYRYYKKQI